MRELLVLSSKSLVDDVARELRRSNWQLNHAWSGPEARKLLAQQTFLVGLCIFWNDDSVEHRTKLGEVISDYPQVRWVVALPRDDVQHETCTALIATRVYDYFSLPLDLARLSAILGHAYGMTEVGIRFLQQQKDAAAGRYGMVGRSAAMRALFRDIERATKSEAPVLIIGETGTGKKRTARAIHSNSPRVDRAFVPVSCGTTSTSVVEQALFGCVDAAPSRASRRNVEPLESAAGGTLFLDDIADMPLATQARLLGFLTERERTPPDDGAPRALDVRIIAATTSDLDEQVKTGRMLSDLFRRLAVIVVRTPPLRERSDDLEMLVHHFVMAAPKRTQSKTIGVSRAALTAIKQYAWPGNLLELENRIFRAVLVSQSPRLSVRDLDLPEYASEPEPVSLEQSRDRTEKETLRYALAHNRHNVTRAAKELRISRMTLYRLLEKHGMDRRN